MVVIQDILIVIAKFLIFIGDVVLLIFGVLWKLIKPIFYAIKKIIHFQKQKVTEKEIYNSETNSKHPRLRQTRVKFKKPDFHLFSFLLSKINNSSLKMKVDLPEFSKTITSKQNHPNIAVPKYKSFTISIASLSFLKIRITKFSSIRLPNLNLLEIKPKKRGRKNITNKIPHSTKIKYLLAGAIVSFIFLVLPLFIYTFIKSLPNPNTLAYQETSQTTKIYDRNKILLYQIYANQNRTNVPLSKIPDHFKKATIAIEDQNFYTTPGFDVKGIVRSAIADISGKPLQGGSTITQQLIKTRLLTPERSFERKIKEVILAVWAEQIYSKDEILEMYFNQVPYGGTAWGAEAASQTYFGKSVENLNLAQSAFLAGLPQAPSTYSPYSGNGNYWKARQREVLNRMTELNYITRAEAEEADNEKLEFKPNQNSIKAPHFVMFVKDLLIQKYGLPVVERGGLSVITSLDLKTQNMAQKVISEEINNAGYLGFSNSAALVTNPKNGDIIAMVGGKDYFDENGGNYNITTALRQPGSTVKVITYAAALLKGETAATQIQDSPVSYANPGTPPYSPVNYDGRFHGAVTLRNALGNSINIPAVKTLNQVGIPNMVNLAKDMGITTWKDPSNYGLAITLGAAETKMTDLATVYGTLANSGKKVELNPILKVITYQGAVLEEKEKPKEKRVLPDEIAFIISNILADNSARSMEFGLNSPLNIPKHIVSVKTGTTDNKRDNWTIGFTPELLTAVWVGNNNNEPMNPILASGITGAAPIWNKIMNNLLANKKQSSELKNPPTNIVTLPCGGKTEFFVKGTENRGNCKPISINGQKPNP